MTPLLQRYVSEQIKKSLLADKSVLLLGPRQVGKSTLIREELVGANNLITIFLQDPSVRLRYERDPGMLIRDVEGGGQKIIVLDEVQKVPELMDSVQYLIDEKHYQFILTGSSARKLRRQNINLLPGRVMMSRMDPLLWGELGLLTESRLTDIQTVNINPSGDYGLEELMVYGSLPLMWQAKESERQLVLSSYATTYLEEEIRAEALVRKLGIFSLFLQLVAQESGGAVNLTKLSEASGVSLPTVREYFQILKDTLILEELPIFTKKIRRHIVGGSKYYLFDVGVRNAILRAPLVPELLNVQKGILFEHMVVLELIRRSRLWVNQSIKLYYWRTKTGLEVDLVLVVGGKIVPIEIKSGRDIKLGELKGLMAFMEEYEVEKGYVVTQDLQPQRISDKIVALPWNYL